MKRIGDEVERELARSGGSSTTPLVGITAAWPEAVGENVARQSWPLRVSRDGTLHVATSSATWAFELDRLSPEINERLRTLLGDAAPPRLRFAVGPVPEPGRDPGGGPAGRGSEVVSPTPEEAAAADSAAAEIDDPELRDLVARAARASLAKARSGRRF